MHENEQINQKLDRVSKNRDIDKIDSFLIAQEDSPLLDRSFRSIRKSTDSSSDTQLIDQDLKFLIEDISEVKRIVKAIMTADKLSINLLLGSHSPRLKLHDSMNLLINQARKEIFDLKSLISDGYAQDCGSNCQLQ